MALTAEQRDFLLPKAYNAAVRAGAVILDVYNAPGEQEVDMKNDHTPVTEADRRSHELIKAYLGQTRIPMLSEEGREMAYEERRGWDLFWMVDPLDGTKEFLKRNGEFTINIALMADNVPVIGIIYVPYLQKMYFCDRQTGAFVKEGVASDPEAEFTISDILSQGTPLPSQDSGNNPVRIAVSRSHNTVETQEHIAEMMKKYPGAEIVVQGSSYKFCLLAEGRVEYYARMTNTYEWDTAAGELILEMAGGNTEALGGGEGLNYNKESLLNPHFVCRSKFMYQLK